MEDADTTELGSEFQIGMTHSEKKILTKIMVQYCGLRFMEGSSSKMKMRVYTKEVLLGQRILCAIFKRLKI